MLSRKKSQLNVHDFDTITINHWEHLFSHELGEVVFYINDREVFCTSIHDTTPQDLIREMVEHIEPGDVGHLFMPGYDEAFIVITPHTVNPDPGGVHVVRYDV